MKYECTSCGQPVARRDAMCGPCVNRAMAEAEATAVSYDSMMPVVARVVAGVVAGYALVAAFLTLTR